MGYGVYISHEGLKDRLDNGKIEKSGFEDLREGGTGGLSKSVSRKISVISKDSGARFL